ncbi:MAG: hypothetical protein K1X67_26685 [Fimbriimonadaceae bacterium]|nr:hypothetical protein [Fimbriimonadaceae bacterium]
MKILIIDWRKRGDVIRDALAARGHAVTLTRHVDGSTNPDTLTIWNAETKARCDKYVASLVPDLILLHVGNDQLQWSRCLKECYGGHVVVCFTGLNEPPTEVLEECRNNPKHCYCAVRFDTQYKDIPAWETSSEGRLVLQFIENLLNDFLNAKHVLQQFDADLEASLEALYVALKKSTPSDELLQLREKLLGS